MVGNPPQSEHDRDVGRIIYVLVYMAFLLTIIAWKLVTTL